MCSHAAAKLPNYSRRFILIDYFNKSNLSKFEKWLPGDGDYTEICWSCFDVNFNVNFKIVFKTVQLWISRWKNFDSNKMNGIYVKNNSSNLSGGFLIYELNNILLRDNVTLRDNVAVRDNATLRDNVTMWQCDYVIMSLRDNVTTW
jgi:hypothetical protein